MKSYSVAGGVYHIYPPVTGEFSKLFLSRLKLSHLVFFDFFFGARGEKYLFFGKKVDYQGKILNLFNPLGGVISHE